MNSRLILGLLLAVPALAGTTTNRLVWPPPPAEARIEFVRTLAGPKDLGVRRSFWSKFVNVLTGIGDSEMLQRPFGLAVAGEQLLVTDTGANSVALLNPGQAGVQRWTKLGNYRLTAPVAVAADRSRYYVADSQLRVVLGFDRKGKVGLVISNGLERPAGLAVGDEKIFVADAGAHCVRVFSTTGAPVAKFGERGRAPGCRGAADHGPRPRARR